MNTPCISRATAWPAGRDKKLSAVHDKIIAAGGVMGAYNGWERANWFAQPGDDTSEDARPRHGRGPAPGSSASRKNAKRCATRRA